LLQRLAAVSPKGRKGAPIGIDPVINIKVNKAAIARSKLLNGIVSWLFRRGVLPLKNGGGGIADRGGVHRRAVELL